MTINELIPDPKNANKGTKRGNQLVERSLREYGAGRSILIDKHGKIIAGNIGSATYPLAEWTRSAAKEVGFQYIKTDEFPMTRRVGAGMDDEVATEPVIVLVKP